MTTVSYEIKDTDQRYWVYEVDSHGVELPETSSGSKKFVSETFATLLSDPEKPITDVIIAMHGWNTVQKGEEEIVWFDGFFDALMRDYRDFPLPPGTPTSNPLLIGVHWPSAPGSGRANERFDSEATFEENVKRMEALAKHLLKTDPRASNRVSRLLKNVKKVAGGTKASLAESAVKDSLDKLASSLVEPESSDGDETDSDDDSAQSHGGPNVLVAPEPIKVAANQGTSDDGMSSGSPSPPSAAPAPTSEEAVLAAAEPSNGPVGFVKSLFMGVLRPIEELLFGKFVKRAEAVGGGVHRLLALLQEASAPSTRFHLVAHSLGGIALCRALAGPSEAGSAFLLRKKVTSATLLQASVDARSMATGGDYATISHGLRPVAGPLVVTTSQSDKVLPLFDFFYEESLGLRGALDVNSRDVTMGDLNAKYTFGEGEICNVKADGFIDEGDFFAGSHSDVHDREVMRLIRQAMQTDVQLSHHALDTPLSKEYFRERVLGEDGASSDGQSSPGESPTKNGQGRPCTIR